MIDILLPFYGDPQLLRQSVQSVLAQQASEFRLVVVDDGYPDDTIAPWFAALGDSRVEYHRNETNLGANRNYARALKLAQADHVVVMGADDLMLPTYLDTLTATLRIFPDAEVVTCRSEVIDGDGAVIRPMVDRIKQRLTPQASVPVLLSGERLMVSLMHGNWTYFPSLCWRTETVRAIGFRPDFHVVQDLALLMDVLMRGGAMALSPDVSFRYRRHAGSDSALKTLDGHRFAEEKRYFATIGAELERQGLARAARSARTHLTSRLHAAALLPLGVRSRDTAAVRRLLQHASR